MANVRDRSHNSAALFRAAVDIFPRKAKSTPMKTDHDMLIATVHELRDAVLPAVLAARKGNSAEALDRAATALERVYDWSVKVAAHLDEEPPIKVGQVWSFTEADKESTHWTVYAQRDAGCWALSGPGNMESLRVLTPDQLRTWGTLVR